MISKEKYAEGICSGATRTNTSITRNTSGQRLKPFVYNTVPNI